MGTDSKLPKGHFGAQSSYDRLLIEQPHIETQGLYFNPPWFEIVCPQVEQELTLDGRGLREWFDNACKPAGARIRVVEAVGKNAARIPARTSGERATLAGAPRTLFQFYSDLSLELPHAFPDFTLADFPGRIVVVVSRALDKEEEAQLKGAFQALDSGLELDVDSTGPQGRTGGPLMPLDILPSRMLRTQVSKDLQWLMEADEDFWLNNRSSLLTDPFAVPEGAPRGLGDDVSRCLLDASVLPQKNIRTQVALYDRTCLVFPIGEHTKEAFDGWNIKEHELLDLAENGRVEILLPQPVNRYNTNFLGKLAERAPDALVLSRTLAGITLVDGRRRMPFLYPTFDIEAQQRLLRELYAISRSSGDSRLRTIASAVLTSLIKVWSNGPELLQRRGAMANGVLGAGEVLGALVDAVAGREASALDFYVPSTVVEWAGALGATVFPSNTADHSNQRECELLASIYSGVQPGQEVDTSFGEVAVVLDGLLAIDGDVPISELVEGVSSSEATRLRTIVNRIAEANLDPEFLQDAIETFNKRVRAVESREKHLDRYRIVAPLGITAMAAASAAGVPPMATPLVGLGAWITHLLLTGDTMNDKSYVGPLLDAIRGANSWQSKDVVLVSRLRKKLKS